MTAVRTQGSQQDRLQQARAALAHAEARQDMRFTSSFKHGFSDREKVALNRGVYHVDGSIEGLAETLAAAVEPGQYVAVIGVADIAWQGFAALGIDVSHMVLVRHPQERILPVMTSLIEGFSVVVVGQVDLLPRSQRVLAARARKLGGTILTMQPWYGVSSMYASASASLRAQDVASVPVFAPGGVGIAAVDGSGAGEAKGSAGPSATRRAHAPLHLLRRKAS